MTSTSPPLDGQNGLHDNRPERDAPPTSVHPEIRSPSPKRHDSTTSNYLGLGLASGSTSQQPVITQYPHLAHYVFSLLANILHSPPRAANGVTSGAPAHPLSVSSSGESDGSDEDKPGSVPSSLDTEQKTPKKSRNGAESGSGGLDKESLVRTIVRYLDNEEEEQVKELLKPHMGDLAKVSS